MTTVQDARLAEAIVRYKFTPRETDVLVLVLDGCRLKEMEEALHITSSTIQDHLYRLQEKTAARNRSAMIAKVLGWTTD